MPELWRKVAPRHGVHDLEGEGGRIHRSRSERLQDGPALGDAPPQGVAIALPDAIRCEARRHDDRKAGEVPSIEYFEHDGVERLVAEVVEHEDRRVASSLDSAGLSVSERVLLAGPNEL